MPKELKLKYKRFKNYSLFNWRIKTNRINRTWLKIKTLYFLECCYIEYKLRNEKVIHVRIYFEHARSLVCHGEKRYTVWCCIFKTNSDFEMRKYSVYVVRENTMLETGSPFWFECTLNCLHRINVTLSKYYVYIKTYWKL